MIMIGVGIIIYNNMIGEFLVNKTLIEKAHPTDSPKSFEMLFT